MTIKDSIKYLISYELPVFVVEIILNLLILYTSDALTDASAVVNN